MSEINQTFTKALVENYGKHFSDVNRSAVCFLSDNHIKFTSPSKGHFKIVVNKNKCKALMFYPKSGKLIIQLNGKNRAHPFVSDNPVVILNKIISLCEKD